jgi:hypothetical protein
MATIEARIAKLEQSEAEAFARSFMRLTNDELDARMAVFGATPIPRHLYERITGEYLRRLRLMSEEDLAAWDAAHFTPEESARIDARVAAELAAEGWVRPDEL